MMTSKQLLFDSIDTNWIECVSLPLSHSPSGGLKLSQCLSHCSGLLATQVKRLVLLLPVELPQVLPLVLTDDGQHSSNRLPYHFAAYTNGKLVSRKKNDKHLSLTANFGTWCMHFVPQ